MGAIQKVGAGLLTASAVFAAPLLNVTFPAMTEVQLIVAWAILAGAAATGTVMALRPVKPPVKPSRDVILDEAISYATLREWGKRFPEAAGGPDNTYSTDWQRCREMAARGDLTIWGKRAPHAMHEAIPAEFWVDHQPEWFSMWRGDAHTEPTVHGASETRFQSLMASRSQFEAIWPKRRWRRRLQRADR